MNTWFLDSILQKKFDEDGYVQLKLLSVNEIRQLVDLSETHASQFNRPFHTTHFSTDVAYKAAAHNAICEIVFTRVKDMLTDCIPIFGNFMIKQPDASAFMPLHADWTYVDENKVRSMAIWIPLVDTDMENGCLGVIEGSHKILNKIRGPRIQQTSYKNDKEWVKLLGKLLPAKAGEAIIYDHALLHYSPPNKSGKIRPAINLSLVPTGIEVIHYCIPENSGEIEMYKVDNSDFYINYNNFQRPERGILIKTLAADSVSHIDGRMQVFTGA